MSVPQPTPQSLVKRINEYIVSHSGFETRRDYLSMSNLSECPRRIVQEYRDGFKVEAYTHHMAFAGYEHERNMIGMLTDLGVLDQVNVEVTAPFDSRLRGHLDGVCGGDVIEIKSVSRKQFDKVAEKQDKVLWKHYMQVQMYMRYSGLRRALVIYRNRETYEHMVIAVPYSEVQSHKFEEKAKDILLAIDEERLPECECGKCEG